MQVDVDIQRAVDAKPQDSDFQNWVEAVLNAEQKSVAELTIRIVGEEEITDLNEQYRNKPGATNVLSFPFECPPEVELNLLGDLVICDAVVEREANEQGKTSMAHWAHMVVHGTLHLLGYDHIDEHEAHVMESKEISIMKQLGYDNPYELTEDTKKD